MRKFLTPDQYIQLREHLTLLDPIIGPFCTAHGFREDHMSSVGRYPRRRLRKETDTMLIIDLQAEYDVDNNPYLEFWPGLPYMLWICSHYDETRFRYCSTETLFCHRPFEDLVCTLEFELARALVLLEKWDREFLLKHAMKSELTYRPPDL